MNILIESLTTTGAAILKLLILSITGFIFVKNDIISGKGLKGLSSLVIYLTLPCLIFTNFVKNFRIENFPFWWLFPLGGFILIILGIFIGGLVGGFLNASEKRQLRILLGFPNSGYLPLAITGAILSSKIRETAFIYIFLIIMGTALSLWSIGVKMVSSDVKNNRQTFRNILNPPFISILISITIALTNAAKFIPDIILKTTSMAGDITVPLIMVVLGGMLASVNGVKDINIKGISILAFTKLILFPSISLFFLYLLRPPEIIGLIILIETAVPPATNLIVIGDHYGGETEFLNQGLLYSYVISIITIPVFISIFYCIYSC